MATTPTPIRSLPGIKRDGTQFDSDQYLDGRWCRFQRDLPKKMGGYRAITSLVPEKKYGLDVYSQSGLQYAHAGGVSDLHQIVLDAYGNVNALNTRTPAGFAANVDNLWQFDILFDDVGSNVNFLIAHAGQNMADITSSVETPIYVGDVTTLPVLTASAMGSQSGGVVVLPPYLLGYGNSGKVEISAAGAPSGAAANTAFVTGSKIITGQRLRGSGSGPSGLLWSLDSLIRATFTSPTAGFFAFDTISDKISILSSRSVVEHDGIFYWVGVDRFMMFSGIVQPIPNRTNLNWFFRNLNTNQRQKVFSFKIPMYNEIWWCFPYGSATECTHAVILNTEGMFWYDTELPSSMRTSGYFPQGYNRPYLLDGELTATGYSLWQHEVGTDEINGSSIQPIRSFFKTAEISMLKSQEPSDKSLHVAIIEPDFLQTGDLTMTVEGRSNARATDRVSDSITFPDIATNRDNQILKTKEVRRLMSFRFESNTAGGDYELGRTMAHIEPDDGRITQ
jgi:hypothetical protein